MPEEVHTHEDRGCSIPERHFEEINGKLEYILQQAISENLFGDEPRSKDTIEHNFDGAFRFIWAAFSALTTQCGRCGGQRERNS